jgi:hypothetical protein
VAAAAATTTTLYIISYQSGSRLITEKLVRKKKSECSIEGGLAP